MLQLIDQYPMNVGDLMTVSFDLESREFNGRWYTDVRAWKAEKAQDPNQQTAAQQAADPFGGMPGGYPAPPTPPADIAAPAGGDDLPF